MILRALYVLMAVLFIPNQAFSINRDSNPSVAVNATPAAVDTFTIKTQDRKKAVLSWSPDKKAKSFRVGVMNELKKGKFKYFKSTKSPNINLYGLKRTSRYVVEVTPIGSNGVKGPSRRVVIYRSNGLKKITPKLSPVGHVVNSGEELVTASVLGSTASENLVNSVGYGVNPNLTLTLVKTGVCNWPAGYTIHWDEAGGIPVKGSNDDPCGSGYWSSWDVKDSSNNAYYGNVTLNNDGKKVWLDSYSESGTAGNRLVKPYITDGSGAYPTLYAESVVCSYCGAPVLLNEIDPSVVIELGANQANAPSYTLGYDTPFAMPEGWSVWNVFDSGKKIYFGTISLSRSGSSVSLAQDPYYVPPNPPGTEYLTDIKLTSDVTKEPLQARLTAVVHCGAACNGPFADAPPAVAPQNFLLTTSGNRLLLNGQPIRLKGWARPSLEWSSMGEHFSENDILNMKGSGANTIRISMNAQDWLNSKDVTVNGSYKQIIDAIVYFATKNKMMVVLDYHKFTEAGSQELMAIKDIGGSSLKFWTEVATKYKTFGNVLFELYNEPVDISYNTWLNGDASWYGMQNLYDAVRATGAKNVVVIAGLEWSYYLGFISDSANNCNGKNCFVKDPTQPDGLAYNAVYNAHPYTIDGRSYKGANGYQYLDMDGNLHPADFSSNFSGIKDRYPIMWTEFGARIAADYSDPTFYGEADQEMLNEANELGIHVMGWAWYIKSAEPWFPVDIDGDWTNPEAKWGGEIIFPDYFNNPPTDLSGFFNH